MNLGTTSWLQRISIGLLVLSLAGMFFGASGSWVFWASLLCLNAFRKQVLWRVRNRLLLTFFLFGVVPLFLIGLMLLFTVLPFLGHFASERVREDLEIRIATVSTVAKDMALAASRASTPELLDAMRQRVPRMNAVVRMASGPTPMPGNSSIQDIPEKMVPEFQGLMEFRGEYYIAARARGSALGADVLVYVPFDEEARLTVTAGVVEVAAVFQEDDKFTHHVGPDGSLLTVERNALRTEIRSRRLPGPRGRWDMPVAGILSLPVETTTGEKREIVLATLSRPSLLLSRYVASPEFPSTVAVLMIAGGFLLFVELVSLVLSVLHTRAITRSVHDLYEGTLAVAAGDFTQQIPVRGKHQLSELAASFNSMTAQTRHFLEEMKKKEKIESELEIARQVQARLFPRFVPELRTLEMRGVCIPGRYISGDYYDFVKLNDRYTAIALGDVSGKGVSAALLMASIQASLHAQLGFGHGLENPVLSTATLMALIGQQLYESTPAEKYATFFCSVYDDQAGMLRYTNAGHLKPILIREGKASVLEGGGMVVGLMPNVTYEQQEIQLLAGDLVAIFSDGIPEAENKDAQEYGEARLAELLRVNATKPLDEVIKIATASVDAWAYDPAARDDTTIVVMRRR